jgi:hypothetical protein
MPSPSRFLLKIIGGLRPIARSAVPVNEARDVFFRKHSGITRGVGNSTDRQASPHLAHVTMTGQCLTVL